MSENADSMKPVRVRLTRLSGEKVDLSSDARLMDQHKSIYVSTKATEAQLAPFRGRVYLYRGTDAEGVRLYREADLVVVGTFPKTTGS